MISGKKVLGSALVTVALGVPVLIGGKIVDKLKYPAVVRISSGGGGCTAAIVGPNALLTAAHCVGNGGKVSFQHSGLSYTSEGCVHHPGYKNNSTQDFALCKVKDVKAPWISVNTKSNLVAVGDVVTLAGYGCTNKGGGGGNDGYLRMGEAKVLRVPSGSNFDIVSKGVAALCFGDSGGPAFKGKTLIGVNSRGNIDDTSYLSAVHMADQDYMLAWSKSSGAVICGVSKDCEGGGSKPPEIPKPNPDPEEMAWWERLILWLADLIWSLIVK